MRDSVFAAARCVAAATLVFGSSLHAQTWVTLPNGELGYITNYTTTGFFLCGNPLFLVPGGSCSTSGSSITLGSGGSSMTMTFHGLTQLILATNTFQPVLLGSITKTFSGSGPFLFPQGKNVNDVLFYFSMVLTSSNPVAATGLYRAAYLPVSQTVLPRNCCDYMPEWVTLPIAPPPPNFQYNYIIYNGVFGTTMTTTPGTQLMGANVGIAPEPATLWLTGTGLIGLGALVRRRRTKSSA